MRKCAPRQIMRNLRDRDLDNWVNHSNEVRLPFVEYLPTHYLSGLSHGR